MTNISEKSVERLASVFDQRRNRHDAGTVSASFDQEVAQTLRALSRRVVELEAEKVLLVELRTLEKFSGEAP